MTSSSNWLKRHCLLACLSVMPLIAAASPSSYPEQPVRIVLPYAAGGSTDIVARLLAQRLSMSLGQPFIVENKPGASGNIGAEQVSKAKPDGYTLVLLPDSNLTINPHIYKQMGFDPRRTLTPISMLAKIDIGLVAHPSVPANTIPEFVEYAKNTPQGVSFGTPGAGTPHHLAGELLKQLTGANMVHIAYKGGGPAVTDLLGNQIPAGFVALAAARPHIESGKLKLLGVTQSSRSQHFPSAPTIGESVQGFDVTSWMALFAPADTPMEIIRKLNTEIRATLLDPSIQERLAKQALAPSVTTPEELSGRIETEYLRWGKLINERQLGLNQ
jgi:tripartite-type tricarboxylate transporter receptor subunit TctC